MGLILDSSVLIAAERRGDAIEQVIQRVHGVHGDQETALSVISIIELTHGIYRAKTAAHRERRIVFMEDVCTDLIVHPVTLAIAQLAGRIEGEQAAKGIAIPFEDLVIGATAIHLGFDVVTLNEKHFRLIPNLKTVTL
jgi:predicted nucleic acid-binding protein